MYKEYYLKRYTDYGDGKCGVIYISRQWPNDIHEKIFNSIEERDKWIAHFYQVD